MSAEPHAQEADDPGEWEFHEGDGPWAGWLYRYADGTLVAQDGTVLEEPPAEPPESSVVPVETSTEPAVVESPVEPVETSAEPAVVEPPVEPVETSAERAETSVAGRGPGDWVFHDGTDHHEGWLYHHTDGRLEREDGTLVEPQPGATLEPQPAPEPAPAPVPTPDPPPIEEPEPTVDPVPAARDDRGPGDWVFHDGSDDTDPHDGWLYHHTDGRLEREDGTAVEPAESVDHERAPVEMVPEEPASDERAPVEMVPEEPASDERASRRTVAAQPPQGPEDDGAEGTSEPTASSVEPVETTGDTDPHREPAPTSSDTTGDADLHRKPTYLRWEASVVPQYVAGVVFVAAAIGAAVLLVDFLGDTASGRLVPAVGLVLLAGAALLALSSLAPTVVTLRGSVVEVAHGETVRRYDLAESGVRLDLQGSPSSMSWQARLGHPDGDVDLLRRRQVDPREFTDAVRAYRPEA